MKLNGLGFLSLLALIGIFGFITPNKALLGFWGFAVYLRYFFVIPDELFRQNTTQAASIGFFSGIASTAVLMVGRILLPQLIAQDMVLLSSFVVSVLVFTCMLMWLEIKEARGDTSC